MRNHPFAPIVAKTLSYYNQQAEEYFAGTKDHDVSQNIQSLLQALHQRGLPPFTILDFGSGPGRDLVTFKKLGHQVIGLDGSSKFCEMARELAGVPVWEQDFTNLGLPEIFFDGIFANASLFHTPRPLLPTTLGQLHRCLKPQGILFCSNPRGTGEKMQGLRYGNYMELDVFNDFLQLSHFKLIHHYYRPNHLPLQERPWLATVSEKQKKPKEDQNDNNENI